MKNRNEDRATNSNLQAFSTNNLAVCAHNFEAIPTIWYFYDLNLFSF